MSTVGEVVFCVDCDLARSAHLNTAAAGGAAEALHEHPRRMATKKDPSGAALCAACLDARLRRRRAEFERRQGEPPVSEAPAPTAVSAQVARAPVRKLSAVRIERVRSSLEISPANDTKRAVPEPRPEPERETEARAAARTVSVKSISPSAARKLERAFLELGVAIGFVRAQELIDELRSHAFAIADGAR